MPITKSAKKAVKSSRKKRIFNLRRLSAMKSTVIDAKKAATSKVGDVAKFLSEAYKAIDKALKTGVIKKNTAARKKSRLAKSLSKSK